MQDSAVPNWLADTYEDDDLTAYALIRFTSPGETLFDALHYCLGDISSNPYTAEDLQRCVAKSILQTDVDTRSTHATLKSILHHAISEKDNALLEEYKWAEPILYDDLEAVSVQMLDPNVYKGDAYAVYVLEKVLNARIVVIEKVPLGMGVFGAALQESFTHAADYDPNFHFVLCHATSPRFYYRPLAARLTRRSRMAGGQQLPMDRKDFNSAFQRDQVPAFLQLY